MHRPPKSPALSSAEALRLFPQPTRRTVVAAGAGLVAALSPAFAQATDDFVAAARTLAGRAFGDPFRDLLPGPPTPRRSNVVVGALQVSASPAAEPFADATDIEVVTPEGPVLIEGGGALLVLGDGSGRPSTHMRFRGATVFELAGPAGIFGAAARALAIRVADPLGEEIPVFRLLSLSTAPGGGAVVRGLVDSPSATAALRIDLDPAAPGSGDFDLTIFPRTDMVSVGLGSLTALFLHAPGDGRPDDDVRPAVHEAEGLSMLNGARERLWRPLLNPPTLQVSAFADDGPAAFALVQRNRDPVGYLDPEAAYDRRPSLVVEPVGDWGRGFVTLVEIPSRSEENDNAIAFWQPETPLSAGAGRRFAYRLTARDEPVAGDEAARILSVRSGAAPTDEFKEARRFVVLYRLAVAAGADTGMARASVRAEPADVVDVRVHRLSETIVATAFTLRRAAGQIVDFRADLYFERVPPAEVLLHRWA